MPELRANLPLNPQVLVVGAEETRVLVIDDPLESTRALRDLACGETRFQDDRNSAYPGVRGTLPPTYAELLVPELIRLVNEFYAPPKNSACQLIHQLFSLVSREPSQLLPLQRVPHFDSHDPFYFATVHYLNPEPHGGTGFFRHRPTAYERITQQRFPSFVAAGEAHMRRHGMPPEAYIADSTEHFELIETVDYRPNRMLLYPSNLLHSGLIQPDRDIDDNPRSGRLTANLFLLFSAPAGA